MDMFSFLISVTGKVCFLQVYRFNESISQIYAYFLIAQTKKATLVKSAIHSS